MLTGTIVENSLQNKSILSTLEVVKTWQDGDWTLHNVLVSKEQIPTLAAALSDGAWYFHLWQKGSDDVYVVFRDKVFLIKHSDKSTWSDAIAYGKSIGVPDEQLDFVIESDRKVHEMRLHPTPFEMIRNGSKTVEVRLNDEKRRLMQIGDVIEFSLRPELTEKFQAEVVGLDTFKSFKDAYAAYPPAEYGGKDKEEWELMYKYYSPEEEEKYGVLGIRLNKI